MALHVTPKASKDEIVGIVPAGRGFALRIKVTAAPDRGRANVALLGLLARTWGLPASRLSIERGASSRLKTVLVAGEPDHLAEAFAAWCRTLDR